MQINSTFDHPLCLLQYFIYHLHSVRTSSCLNMSLRS